MFCMCEALILGRIYWAGLICSSFFEHPLGMNTKLGRKIVTLLLHKDPRLVTRFNNDERCNSRIHQFHVRWRGLLSQETKRVPQPQTGAAETSGNKSSLAPQTESSPRRSFRRGLSIVLEQEVRRAVNVILSPPGSHCLDHPAGCRH